MSDYGALPSGDDNHSIASELKSLSLPTSSWNTARKQLVLLSNLALPITIINMCNDITWTASSAVAGHYLGPAALGGFSLAALIANIVGRSFFYGVLDGYTTLAGNAIGAKNLAEIGILTQRALFVSIIIFFLVSGSWLVSWHLMHFLHQPSEATNYAADFLRKFIFVLPAEFSVELIRGFHQCQDITMPFVYMMMIVLPLHLLVLFAAVPTYGFDGVLIAHAASNYAFLFLCVMMMTFMPLHDPRTLGNLNWAAALNYQEMKEFLSLVLPAILGFSSWWFWEVQSLLIGSFGETPLSAHAMAENVYPLFSQIPYAISVALQTRVATLVGQGSVATAKNVVIGSYVLITIVGLVSALICYEARFLFYEMFLGDLSSTSDAPVVSAAETIWWMVSTFSIIDSQHGLGCCVLSALRFQGRQSIVNFIGLFVIGLPLEIMLGFWFDMELKGLWLGFYIAYLLIDIGVWAAIVFGVRWDDSLIPPAIL